MVSPVERELSDTSLPPLPDVVGTIGWTLLVVAAMVLVGGAGMLTDTVRYVSRPMNPAETLAVLAELRSGDLLTEEEFDRVKARVLQEDRPPPPTSQEIAAARAPGQVETLLREALQGARCGYRRVDFPDGTAYVCRWDGADPTRIAPASAWGPRPERTTVS